MTRQNAIKLSGYDEYFYDLINKIYDDFDDEVCESCLHWSQEHINLGICRKSISELSIKDISEFCTSGSFGCKNFEANNG